MDGECTTMPDFENCFGALGSSLIVVTRIGCDFRETVDETGTGGLGVSKKHMIEVANNCPVETCECRYVHENDSDHAKDASYEGNCCVNETVNVISVEACEVTGTAHQACLSVNGPIRTVSGFGGARWT